MDLFKCFLVILVSLTVYLKGYAQFNDDFSDGDHTHNPGWVSSDVDGNGADFIVSDSILMSDGPQATSSIWLSTPNVPDLTNHKVVWTFDVNYSSSPSSSNRVLVYLSSDRENLSDTPAGYYIRLGESGSDDGIDLYKSASTQPVIADPGSTVASSISHRIRVTREVGGLWRLEAAPLESGNFQVIGEAIDDDLVSGRHFGFLVYHTSTKSKSFSFDNVSITAQDVTAPELKEVSILDAHSLQITFSEAVDHASAILKENYSLVQGDAQPASCIMEGENTVKLSFADAFISGRQYTLKITDLSDMAGNRMEPTLHDFMYYQNVEAAYKEVLINEIMADPDGAAVADAEYVELYNASQKTLNLEGWTFSDASTSVTLPEYYLTANSYVVLSQASDGGSGIANVLTMGSWPTLNNASDMLALRSATGELIDTIHYDQSWYRSTTKSNGGWSLELIDPSNTCSSSANWTASEAEEGGTPGSVNSVRSQHPDLTPPHPPQVSAIFPDSILITFNEIFDRESALNAEYTVEPDIEVLSVYADKNLKNVWLTLNNDLRSGATYELTIRHIRDCAGNLANTLISAPFHLVEPADSTDVIITEILFNPHVGGADFVEIYNASSKFIILDSLSVGNADKSYPIRANGEILPPHGYVVITENPEAIMEQYPKSIHSKFIALQDLPAYPNESGSVKLLNSANMVIDGVDYSEDMHFALIDNPKGVSLERISMAQPASDTHNWKSAASSSGYATPGYTNSQMLSLQPKLLEKLSIVPKVIVPDGDGEIDFATINYAFDKSGYVGNVRIFDIYGHEVKALAQNDYLAFEGFYTWDGTNGFGQKVRTGYYIILMEVFDLDGNVHILKDKVAVGTQF